MISRRCSLFLLLNLLAACDGGNDPPPAPDTDAGAEREAWTGLLQVRVTGPEGQGLEDAVVSQAGAAPEAWARTDSDGRASLRVVASPHPSPYVTAGKVGWYSAGAPLPGEGPAEQPLALELQPLPSEDNLAYVFQEGGSSENMGGTGQCMHCHISIGEQWNRSAHRRALSNPRTRDLFNGTALMVEERGCEALGGRWVESPTVGAERTSPRGRCVVDEGVLPDFNAACGAEGQPSCDDAALDRSLLTHFGGCGDCHGASLSGAAGAIDLNAAGGYILEEGVTCDLCHKIAEVTPRAGVGIDGAIRLQRPSVPAEGFVLEWEPIQFGPYPDVLNALMGGSYQPQFSQSVFCAGCHEHLQPALSPAAEERIDGERWPLGVPVQTTFSEWEASPYALDTPCQTCHMLPLEEDSSTIDLGAEGFRPSVAMGWSRPSGQVRRHDWPSVAELGAEAVGLELAVREEGEEWRVDVTVKNIGAGHALPTGEPMRQLAVLVEARRGDEPVPASGGQAIPDGGGYLAQAVLGSDARLEGELLILEGLAPPAAATRLRFVRPTGRWDDYAGPGVGWFSAPERSAEDKGLALFDVLGEVEVAGVDAEGIRLAGAAPAVQEGDHVYVVGEGMWAGAAGWLYSKVLLSASGARSEHHYRAVDIASDNRIASGASATSQHRFPKSGGALEISARVIYRRQAAAVAQRYGWPYQDLVLVRESLSSP